MNIKAAQTKFEQDLLELLSGDIPEPKYTFWQQTTDGKIVGLYWESVEVAFTQQTKPGWVYTVERNGDQSYIPEQYVELVDVT